MRASSHPLFARCSHAARALFVRCSRVVRALFVRARTHPRTTRRARHRAPHTVPTTRMATERQPQPPPAGAPRRRPQAPRPAPRPPLASKPRLEAGDVGVLLRGRRRRRQGGLGPFNFSMPGCCCCCVPPAGTSKGQAGCGGRRCHAQPACFRFGVAGVSVLALRSKEAAPGRVGAIQFLHAKPLLLRAAGGHQQRAGELRGGNAAAFG